MVCHSIVTQTLCHTSDSQSHSVLSYVFQFEPNFPLFGYIFYFILLNQQVLFLVVLYRKYERDITYVFFHYYSYVIYIITLNIKESYKVTNFTTVTRPSYSVYLGNPSFPLD